MSSLRLIRAETTTELLTMLLASFPDPREDLESRSPNLGPYTTKSTL